MIEVSAPSAIAGPLLTAELAATGLVTDFFVVDDRLVLSNLDESRRTQAEAVVKAHATTAKGWLANVAAQRANEETIRQRAAEAIQANLAWVGNVLTQIQAGVDAIQAKSWPNKPGSASNIAGVNNNMNLMWDQVLIPLVQQVADLSQAVERLAQERKRSSEIENALIRLALQQFDSQG